MSELFVNGQAGLPVHTPGVGLVRQRVDDAVRLPEKKTEEQAARRRAQKQTSWRTSDSPAPTVVLSPSALPKQPAEPSPWSSQIPASAIFYDEMTHLEKGLGLPGLMISIRA